MSDVNTQRIKQYLIKTARYYGRELDDYMIRAWSEDMSDLPANEVERAFNLLRRDPKRRSLPMPAEIRECINPAIDIETQAYQLVAEIQKCLGSCPGNRFDLVQERVSKQAAQVIKRWGGWSKLSRSTDSDSALTAQLRDHAKAYLKLQEVEQARHQLGCSLPDIEEAGSKQVPMAIGQILNGLKVGQHGQSDARRPARVAAKH